MPRIVARLTDLKVRRIEKPGLYADGAGLYLQVSPSGTKSWIYRYMLQGKAREMGLGAYSQANGLAEARSSAATAQRQCQQGIDPIETRRADRARAQLDSAKSVTFKEATKRYIDAHRAGWRNDKHASQWESTLKTYAEPHFGNISIQAIDVGLILRALEPIWTTKPETASRVRGRIETILDWAAARGYRSGENPARWRGHLDKILPAKSKVQKVKHHAALPFKDLPAFMLNLSNQEGNAARALEFTILTAARTGEVIGAQISEIQREKSTWTVPASRMKAGREHRVPLSANALAVIDAVTVINTVKQDGQICLFPTSRTGAELSNMAMLKLLERMGRDDITVHGFRSTFRDWAAEVTQFSREVVEMALAHVVGDKVEAAYRRGDLFDKRRELMDAWTKYCMSANQSAQIIPLRKSAADGE